MATATVERFVGRFARNPSYALFIYHGDAPNFTESMTNNQSGVNMVGLSDLRYDTSQNPGGNVLDTYAHALEVIDRDTPVTRVSLVLDGGMGRGPAGHRQQHHGERQRLPVERRRPR